MKALKIMPNINFKRVLGFTLIELLVCMAIIALLTAMAIPAFSKAMLGAKQAKSTGNLKSIGQCIFTYAADNQGILPMMCGVNGASFGDPLWCLQTLDPYFSKRGRVILSDPLVPSGRHHAFSDYAANSDVLRCAYPGFSATETALPMAGLGGRASNVMMVMAAEDGARPLPNGLWYIGAYSIATNPTAPWGRPSDRGTGKILAVFADGHTEAVPKVDFIRNARNYLIVNP
ncbi:MAG: hypothetical protein B9S32_04230 [Verrucomicrobia bacterium Tous-C9LFEB]|nr:MAG: hypothetical protein B9S32_04230 [Verrucomicrobia bacterium Tous-C9LFEB]